MLKKLYGFFVKPYYRCLICRHAVRSKAYPFCHRCGHLYSRIISHNCYDCGKPLWECSCIEVEPCLGIYRLFDYKGFDAMRVLYTLKKRASVWDYEYVTSKLVERIYATSGQEMRFDCIGYVPREKKSIDRYGYDQSKRLAMLLAQSLGCEWKPLIAHTGIEGEQKRLSREFRGVAAKTRFKINESALVEGKLPYKRVLLADDIITTGATMSECARILKSYGVKQVFGIAIAHTPGRKNWHLYKGK